MGNYIFTLVLIWLVFPVPAMAQETPSNNDPPSVHFGNWLTLNPRTRIQLDLRSFQPELDDQTKIFRGRSARFGVDGTLFRDIGYMVRTETTTGPVLRDFFFVYQRFRPLQVQAGRFKIPFGLDQLTDSSKLDFVQRSRLGSIVAPGRDTGAMIFGQLEQGKIQYSAGAFRHDGRNSEIEDFASTEEFLPGGNRTLAARVSIQPLELLSVSTPIHDLTFSAAFTHGDLVTGLSSMHGATVSNQVFFPRVYASGARTRRGAEWSGTLGSLAIKGEFMDVREQRLGQGLNGENLPALRTQGWFLSAVQPVFGSIKNTNRGGFLRSILPGAQRGLLEATARYEVIRFGSESSDGTAASPSRSPRAANVVGNDDRAWTFGLNWHASRYMKFQLNGIRETLRDPLRTPVDGKTRYWTTVARLQLNF